MCNPILTSGFYRKYVDLGYLFIMSQTLLFGYFFDVSLRALDIRVKHTYTYTVTVREVLKLLRHDGWFPYEQNVSYIQLKHPVKKGRVTIPNHKGDLKKGTLHSIFKQAGLE
jgi:predicted RNA binding protein YcfA (HicA-like mRNA interferase family)